MGEWNCHLNRDWRQTQVFLHACTQTLRKSSVQADFTHLQIITLPLYSEETCCSTSGSVQAAKSKFKYTRYR